MRLFGAAGVALFMLTSAVVGGRLFVLWWRTRRLPELLIATALWCSGCLGFALGMISRLMVQHHPAARVAAASFALGAEYVGALAVLVFAWRVFHPRARWAAALAALIAAALVAAVAAEVLSGQYLRYSDGLAISGPWVPLGLAARALAPLWMAIECWRYRALLQRRLRLGLAEPAVAHRFALWGTASAATGAGYALSVVHRAVFGTGLQAHVWALDTVSALALVSAVGVALAFFPPSSYRRWVGEAE